MLAKLELAVGALAQVRPRQLDHSFPFGFGDSVVAHPVVVAMEATRRV